MSRTTKTIGFSVPPTVAKEVETLARKECRTKSELFREMVRVYRHYHDQRDRAEEGWIKGVIDEASTEQEKRPMSAELMLKESDRLSRYGARQASKAGVKPTDTGRIVHAYRARKQA